MTYDQIKKQLREQYLEEEFCSLFEILLSDGLLLKIKETEKIHSTASLIRSLISYLPLNSELYNYWVNIFNWYMHPEFARPKKISDWIIQKQ